MNCTFSSEEYPRVPLPPEVFGKEMKTSEDTYNLVKHFAEKKTECGIMITVNNDDKPIAARVVSIGGRGQGTASICDMIRVAVQDHATGIIFAHNHPSGELEPSEYDWEFLRNLQKDSYGVGVRIVDCFIFSQDGYQSMLAPRTPAERIRSATLRSAVSFAFSAFVQLGSSMLVVGEVLIAVVVASITIVLSQGLPATQLSSLALLTLIYPLAFVCKSIGMVGQILIGEEPEEN